jgi:sRNA-binding regulator protein Hfq
MQTNIEPRARTGSGTGKAKGHDAVLTAIMSQERELTVILMSGDEVKGKIVGKDKYTITVRTVNDKYEPPIVRREVIFKHAIERLWADEGK